jgi:hypothetical protein
MRNHHTVIVRISTDTSFRPSQSILRSIIADALVAWPRSDFSLTSISPIPSDRYIKKRRSPTKRDRLPQLPGF